MSSCICICIRNRRHVWQTLQHGRTPPPPPIVSTCFVGLRRVVDALAAQLRRSICVRSRPAWTGTFKGCSKPHVLLIDNGIYRRRRFADASCSTARTGCVSALRDQAQAASPQTLLTNWPRVVLFMLVLQALISQATFIHQLRIGP